MKELEPALVVEPGRAYEVTNTTLTRDHFTPRAIGKLLGWNRDQINHPDNIQLIPWKEHREKDATTPWELQTVQKTGGAKTIWEHANMYVVLRKGMPQEAKIA